MKILKFKCKGLDVLSRELYLPIEHIRALEVALHPKTGSLVEENDPGLYYLIIYTDSIAATLTFRDRKIIDEIIALTNGRAKSYNNCSYTIEPVSITVSW
jgi:hypothetical protein